MKKSFMTRVLAVSLSAAMAFSLSSASNLMTASAASTVNLKTTFKTLKVKQTYKMTLKKNTLNWKITKVTTSDKKICTVYNKTASSVMLKGKSVGRAKIRVKVKTTKRKYPKNIKWMTCTAKVVAATPSEENVAFTATAAANGVKEVRVNFSKAVDGVEPANFTVSDGITVSKAELSDDKKSALLEIAGAEYSKTYDLTVTGVKVAGAAQADLKLTFTTPAAEDKWPMTLKAEKPILKADGHDQTLVTFTLSDAQGNPVTDKGVEVAFQASLGKFAEQRVTLQNGKASVMYNSVALMETATAAITATVVESTDNKELMGLTTSGSITLNPKGEDTSIGAVITSATAGTADRVIAYFNQKVNADDFKTATGKLDTNKFTCTVQSGLDNGFYGNASTKTHTIVGIMDVPNEENALQLLVSDPMVDNSNVKVTFENKSVKDSTVSAKNDVFFKLADAHQPSMLKAENEGLRTIKVTFSEAVLPTSLIANNQGTVNVGNTAAQFAADNLNNYLIDGKSISDWWGVKNVRTPDAETPDVTDGSLYKETTKDDTINSKKSGDGWIQVGSYKDGKDTRQTVTITVGSDHYLPAGQHTLTVSNVGDWAAKTDRERNILNTETYDFTVVADDVVPTFEVTEQSPEQWLLTFNSDVDIVSEDDTIKTPRSVQEPIADRKDDQGNNLEGKPSVIRLQRQSGGSWIDISDASAGTDKNPIRVSQILDDKGNGTKQYLVEVNRDWTEVYDTASTRQNYFNYNFRLHVDADKIVNLSNGKKNAVIDIPLNGTIMKGADVESPTVGEITQAKDKNGNIIDSWNVKLSEPVKMSVRANQEGLTPSQTQAAGINPSVPENMGVPVPSAQFIKADRSETVEGIVASDVFIDATDTTINVEPATPLSNGEWDLVISSISDDYGRTTATSSQRITVDHATTASDFRVVWAAVSEDETYTKGLGNTKNTGRYIFVKFSHPVTMTGNSVNAGVNGNYVLDGNTLPQGTQIKAHIKGYDNHMSTTDSITIVLPERAYGNQNFFEVSKENTILNISKAITSLSGATLANGGAIKLPYHYGESTQAAGGTYTSLSARGDAVWGNAVGEIYQPGSTNQDALKTLKDYYQALKNAIASDQYREIRLTAGVDLNLNDLTNADITSVFGRSRTLTVNRAVDIDLRNTKINGNVVFNTSDVVNQIEIKDGTITGASSNGKNAASLTVTAGGAKDFVLNNVRVEKTSADSLYAVAINDVYKDTFVNRGDIQGNLLVKDSNGAGIKNEGTFVGNLVMEASGDVILTGDYEGNNVAVNQSGKLFLGKDGVDSNFKNLEVKVNASGAKVEVNNNAVVNGLTITAAAKNVRITMDKAMLNNGITLARDKNGEFVQVTSNNVEIKDGDNFIPGINGDASVIGGIQKQLQELNVVDPSADGNVDVVTCGAVTTPVAINITDNEAALARALVSDADGKTYSVKASYTMTTADANGVIERKVESGKSLIKAIKGVEGKAKVKVTLTANGVTITRTIEVNVVKEG